MGKKASTYSQKNQEYYWITPIGESQSEYVHFLNTKQVTIAHGVAGSGKSIFALQKGLQLLERHEVDKIIYLRNDPFDKLGGVQLGALPGEVDEKMGPLLGPIVDNIYELCSPGKAKYILDNGLIEAIPTRFLLGRSFANSFIIVDESQNFPSLAMELILTRISRNTKMVITGSSQQKTSQDKFDNGLTEAIKVLKYLPEVGIVELTSQDIQRSSIVQSIVEAYEKYRQPFGSLRVA